MAIRQQRIDPEPITIFLAGMAVYSAAVASLNCAKSHHRPLPTTTRNRVLVDINKIDSLVYEVRQDLSTIRQIFENNGRYQEVAVRLGNGLFLSYDDFSLYQRVSANVFRTLGRAHSLCLKLEYDAAHHGGLEMHGPTNELGAAYEIFESLRTSRDLTVRDAWEGLDKLADHIQVACNRIRGQLQ